MTTTENTSNTRVIVLDALIKDIASMSEYSYTEANTITIIGDVKHAFNKVIRRIKVDGFSDSCISDFINSVPGYKTNVSSLYPVAQYIIDCHRRIHEHLMVNIDREWLTDHLYNQLNNEVGLQWRLRNITLVALANGYKPKEFDGNTAYCRKYVYLIALLFFFAHHEALDQLTAEAKAAAGESK